MSYINIFVYNIHFILIHEHSSNSCTGLGRPLGVQEFEARKLSRHSTHEGGNIVKHKHQPPVPHWRYHRYSVYLEAGSTPGP